MNQIPFIHSGFILYEQTDGQMTVRRSSTVVNGTKNYYGYFVYIDIQLISSENKSTSVHSADWIDLESVTVSDA